MVDKMLQRDNPLNIDHPIFSLSVFSFSKVKKTGRKFLYRKIQDAISENLKTINMLRSYMQTGRSSSSKRDGKVRQEEHRLFPEDSGGSSVQECQESREQGRTRGRNHIRIRREKYKNSGRG